MEPKKKKIMIALTTAGALAVSVALASKAMSGRGHHGWDGHGGKHVERMADWLEDRVDLTSEQHDRLEQLAAGFRERLKTARKPAMDRMAEIVREPSMTAEDAEAFLDSGKDGLLAMKRVLAEHIAEAHGMLTQAQREKLANEIASGRVFGRGHGRRWGWGHRDRGDRD